MHKKKLIHPEGYMEPFEDRRKPFITGDLKPLDGNLKSWLPIVIPVVGVCVSVGMYVALVSSTAVLAKDTQCKVELNEVSSRERDEKISARVTAGENKIARLEECIIGFKVQFDDLKARSARIENKIDSLR